MRDEYDAREIDSELPLNCLVAAARDKELTYASRLRVDCLWLLNNTLSVSDIVSKSFSGWRIDLVSFRDSSPTTGLYAAGHFPQGLRLSSPDCAGNYLTAETV